MYVQYVHIAHTCYTEEGHIGRNACLTQDKTNTEGRGTHKRRDTTEGYSEKKQL